MLESDEVWLKLLNPEPDALYQQLQQALIKLTPTDEEWEQFWTALDDAQIWSWQPEYKLPEDLIVYDGFSWALAIKRGEQQIQSYGSQAQTKGYRIFHKAMGKLIGKQFR